MSRLYSEAASVLGPSLHGEKQRKGGGGGKPSSLKSRTFADGISNKKMTHLLVCETLKHKKLIDRIVDIVGLNIDEVSSNVALVYILIYELLFSKQRKIRGGGGLKRLLVDRQPAFTKAMERIKKEEPTLLSAIEEKKIDDIPRYCRVNTMKTTMKQAIQELQVQYQPLKDEHVSNLLCLPPSTDLHDHALVKQSHIILQDKSSCFPVEALSIEMRDRKLTKFDAIDCCAAPGNKTTQLAAILEGSSAKLYAFDKSPQRCKLLTQRVAQAGGEHRVLTFNDDFLQQDPSAPQLSRVRTILLDPSCSGSGSFSVERINDQVFKEDDPRVLKLAQFQLEALVHALSFEQAELVSYSTCSILYAENEDVVKKALDACEDEWELVEALPSWHRRGVSKGDGLSPAQAKLVLRADYTLGDKTGGFFLALFARKSEVSKKESTRSVSILKTPTVKTNDIVAKPTRKRFSILSPNTVARHRKLLRMIYG